MAVLTGTVAHDGTIPLPSGYTEGQCKWTVSMYRGFSSVASGKSQDQLIWYCEANGTRTVTMKINNNQGNGESPVADTGVLDSSTHWGTANYMIIGVK